MNNMIRTSDKMSLWRYDFSITRRKDKKRILRDLNKRGKCHKIENRKRGSILTRKIQIEKLPKWN